MTHDLLTRAELLAQHCQPLPEAKTGLDAATVHRQLQVLPDWTEKDGALEREFRFANYHQTIAFVNALAWMIHQEDHHPELAVSYDRCRVRFNTHTVHGISVNDFISAAKCDAIFDPIPAPPR